MSCRDARVPRRGHPPASAETRPNSGKGSSCGCSRLQRLSSYENIRSTETASISPGAPVNHSQTNLLSPRIRNGKGALCKHSCSRSHVTTGRFNRRLLLPAGAGSTSSMGSGAHHGPVAWPAGSTVQVGGFGNTGTQCQMTSKHPTSKDTSTLQQWAQASPSHSTETPLPSAPIPPPHRPPMLHRSSSSSRYSLIFLKELSQPETEG